MSSATSRLTTEMMTTVMTSQESDVIQETSSTVDGLAAAKHDFFTAVDSSELHNRLSSSLQEKKSFPLMNDRTYETPAESLTPQTTTGIPSEFTTASNIPKINEDSRTRATDIASEQHSFADSISAADSSNRVSFSAVTKDDEIVIVTTQKTVIPASEISTSVADDILKTTDASRSSVDNGVDPSSADFNNYFSTENSNSSATVSSFSMQNSNSSGVVNSFSTENSNSSGSVNSFSMDNSNSEPLEQSTWIEEVSGVNSDDPTAVSTQLPSTTETGGLYQMKPHLPSHVTDVFQRRTVVSSEAGGGESDTSLSSELGSLESTTGYLSPKLRDFDRQVLQNLEPQTDFPESVINHVTESPLSVCDNCTKNVTDFISHYDVTQNVTSLLGQYDVTLNVTNKINHYDVAQNVTGLVAHYDVIVEQYDFVDDESTAVMTAKAATLSLLALLGVAGNALVIWNVVRQRHLHRPPFYYLLSLSLTDLSRAAFCLPLVLMTLLQGAVWRHGASACDLFAFANTFFVLSSAVSLLDIAADRHLSLIYSRSYRRKSGGAVNLVVVLLSWTLAFLVAFPPVVGVGGYVFEESEAQCTLRHRHFRHDNDTLGFLMVFSTLSLITLFLFYRIFLALRQHRRMRPLQYEPARSSTWTFFGPGAHGPGIFGFGAAGHNVGGNVPNFARLPTNRVGFSRVVSLRVARNQHVTRLFFCMTLAFNALWLPYQVLSYWRVFGDSADDIPSGFVTTAAWLSYAQVVVVPLVYFGSRKGPAWSSSRRRASRGDVSPEDKQEYLLEALTRQK